MDFDTFNQYLTKDEFAAQAGVSMNTVQGWIQKGKINALMRSSVYFIHRDELAKVKKPEPTE